MFFFGVLVGVIVVIILHARSKHSAAVRQLKSDNE
jgi:hypothetical protein